MDIRESSARVSRVIESLNKGISIKVDHLRKPPSLGISGVHDTNRTIDRITNILFCKKNTCDLNILKLGKMCLLFIHQLKHYIYNTLIKTKKHNSKKLKLFTNNI